APEADFNGTDSLVYTLTDLFGNTSSATVSLSVTPVNDAPVALNKTIAAVAGASVPINALLGATDMESNTLTLTSVSGALPGTASVNNNGTAGDPADDFIVYTPTSTFTGVELLTYSLSDGTGGTATATVEAHVYGAGQWANSLIAVSSQYEGENAG